MIHPQMGNPASSAGLVHPSAVASASPPGPPPAAGLHATLLGLILTDAPASPKSLQSALTYAVERSFNSISVDSDMSTNNTIIVLVNGAGHDTNPTEIDESMDPQAYIAFRDYLTAFSINLAKPVVRDGEGATKFVGVCIEVGLLFSLFCYPFGYLRYSFMILYAYSSRPTDHLTTTPLRTQPRMQMPTASPRPSVPQPSWKPLYGEDAK